MRSLRIRRHLYSWAGDAIKICKNVDGIIVE